MNKTTEKERIYWIDWVKSMAIAMVVWAHISLLLKKEIFLFHMPLFFLVSGYLYHKRGIWGEAKTILLSLVFPYLIYNLFYILPLPMGGEFKHDTIPNILLGNQEKLCYVMQPLWFIVSLIMMRLLCMSRLRIEVIGLVCLIVSFVLGGVEGLQECDYFQWRTTVLCFPFFCVGWIWRSYFNFCIPFKKTVLIIILLVVFVGATIGGMYNSEHWQHGLNVFHCRIGKNILFFYVVAFTMSITFMCLCRLLLNVKCIIIERLSKGTLLILATHLIIFWKIPKLPIPDILQQLCSLVIVMLISYLLIVLSERYCPILIGKRKK